MRHILFSGMVLMQLTVYSQATFPVKISEDKRYLTDNQGKPFPILGRTAWFLLSQPENGYRHFLDNTLAHGHNAIEISALMHWPTGNHAPYNGNGEPPFDRTLSGHKWNGELEYVDPGKESPDFSTPSEKYWKHVDQLLEYCETKGILVFMFPAYVGYPSEKEEQGWMKEMVANGEYKMQSYGAWIAKRYRKRKNIVWMLLGDKSAFTEKQAKVEEALIRGLKSVEGQESEQYTAESKSGENAADNDQFGQEMTLNGCYTWELRMPVSFMGRKGYNHQPVMPAFLLEEPYDEEGSDGNNYNPNATQPVRRFQWWGWLTTIGGYISGNGYVWPFIDPTWKQHLNTQAALDMKRMNHFIQSLDWWKLVPSGLDGMPDLITNTDNVDTSARYVAAAAARDSSLLVAYMPPGHPGDINVKVEIIQKDTHAYWFDPTNGSYTLSEQQPNRDTATQNFSSPGKNSAGENDWVLVITEKKL